MLQRMIPAYLTIPTVPTVPKEPERQTIPRSARSMGIYVLAGRGTGKSRLLGRKITMQDFLAGILQVIFDPIGATIDNFLDKVIRFLDPLPRVDRDLFWDRIIYVDMSGKDGYITPFPSTTAWAVNYPSWRLANDTFRRSLKVILPCTRPKCLAGHPYIGLVCILA